MKKSVSVIIKNERGEFLVLKHKKCKGLMILPAGTLEEGESVLEAAKREMREELGIEVQDAHIFQSEKFYMYDRIDGMKGYYETIVMVTKYEGVPENKEPEKHEFIKWVTPQEIIDSPMYTSMSTFTTAMELKYLQK